MHTTKTLKDEILTVEIEEAYSNKYGKIYLVKNQNIAICEATERYVPIDKFMELFAKCSEVVKSHNVHHFIFDKRSLRSFHQPSMEWYFIEWKQDMLKVGLKRHYKILPDEAWFKKCVEAGRAQILEDYPESNLDQLTIAYVDSVQQALLQIEQSQYVNV